MNESKSKRRTAGKCPKALSKVRFEDVPKQIRTKRLCVKVAPLLSFPRSKVFRAVSLAPSRSLSPLSVSLSEMLDGLVQATVGAATFTLASVCAPEAGGGYTGEVLTYAPDSQRDLCRACGQKWRS